MVAWAVFFEAPGTQHEVFVSDAEDERAAYVKGRYLLADERPEVDPDSWRPFTVTRLEG